MADNTEMIYGAASRFALQIPMVFVVVFIISIAIYYIAPVQAAILGLLFGLVTVAILSVLTELVVSYS